MPGFAEPAGASSVVTDTIGEGSVSGFAASADAPGNVVLPDAVAAVPHASPEASSQVATVAEALAASPRLETVAAGPGSVPAGEAVRPTSHRVELGAEGSNKPVQAAAGAGEVVSIEPSALAAQQPTKKGLFSLFGSSATASRASMSSRSGEAPPASARRSANPAPVGPKPLVDTQASPHPLVAETETKSVIGETAPTQFLENAPGRPVIESGPARPLLNPSVVRRPIVLASYGQAENGLPGVRQSALFEIKRRSGLDDDSDVDVHEDEAPGVMMASAAGMARLAPNGLLTQTEGVDVACLKPSLVRVLKTIEQRFGQRVMVTSGYRNRERNLVARGAKNSLHMYCAAADIQVAGVGKAELASFVRAMPGRGGVGTYCHTNSVHVDIGPERDWNWRCRRRG